MVVGCITHTNSHTHTQTHSGGVLAQVRAARNDPTVKAVVLRVESPGGDALASDIMWREVHQVGEEGGVLGRVGGVMRISDPRCTSTCNSPFHIPVHTHSPTARPHQTCSGLSGRCCRQWWLHACHGSQCDCGRGVDDCWEHWCGEQQVQPRGVLLLF